jgi:hypothetical protein
MVQQDGATVGLQDLLYHALNEAPVYSALVPWVLDCNPQVIQLLQAVGCPGAADHVLFQACAVQCLAG